MTDQPKAAPRIPPLPRAEWTDESREVFAFWGEPDAHENGSATNTMMTFAQHPPLALAFNRFGKHLLLESDISVRTRELIVLRVAWRTQSIYEWHYHVGYGLNAGITLDEIADTKAEVAARDWAEQDRAILEAVDQLFETSRIDDATWAVLARHFDTRQLMDIVFTIGNYVTTAWAIASFGIEIESPDPIGFDLKTASGKAPQATYKPGEVDDWADRNATTTAG